MIQKDQFKKAFQTELRGFIFPGDAFASSPREQWAFTF
jgi:hypothetical protein